MSTVRNNNNNNNNNDKIVNTNRSIIFTETGAIFDKITSMSEEDTSGIQEEEAQNPNQTTLMQMWQKQKEPCNSGEDEKVRHDHEQVIGIHFYLY
jgi:hypothetical protein